MNNKTVWVMAVSIVLAGLFSGNSQLLTHAAGDSALSLETTNCSTFSDAGLSEPEWACGYLNVPENRSNPQSRTIQVAYAIRAATGSNPQPDPVVFLTGGPGASGIENGWGDWRNSSLGNRDLILVDPRGVNYSQPRMDCPAQISPDASTQTQAPTAEESNAGTRQWAQACRASLISQGFDLTAYNSLANASDLDDLRQALGYAQWNLYGISYGTRTALVTMRAFSAGIRSVILDSVLPPQVDRISGDLTTTAASFAALFSACKADPVCNQDYPDLSGQFSELVQKLDQAPMKINVPNGAGKTIQTWVTGGGVAGGLEEVMKRGYLLRLAPLMIARINAGDQSLVENLYPGLPSSDNQANYGVVLCSDVGALFDETSFSAELEQHPDLKSAYAAYADPVTCPIWNAGQAADAGTTAPVQSDIPTLILNGGEFDSATPPAYAELAASTLSNSHLFVFSKYTHSVSYEDCPRSMMAAFLDDPSRAPDSSCLAQMDGLPFITDVYPNQGALAIFITVQNPTSPLALAAGLIGLIFLIAGIGLPIVTAQA